MPRTVPAALKFALTWALLAVLLNAPILLFEFRNFRSWIRIARDPATAAGVFTAKTCRPFEGFRAYAFEADGKRYETGFTVKGGNACDALPANGPVRVYYERGNPADSIIYEPSAALWNEFTSMLIFGLIFPPLILWRLRAWRAQGHWLSWGFAATPSAPPETRARAGRSSARPPTA